MRPSLSEEKNSIRLLSACVAALLIFNGCNVGPKYHPPAVQAPAAYKEVTPENEKDIENWKAAQPSDDVLRGKWWEIFNDPELNTLEDQVNVSNQSIASAEASFMAARAMVKEARSQFFPTVTTDPTITRQKQSNNLKNLVPRPPVPRPLPPRTRLSPTMTSRLMPRGCRIFGARFAIRSTPAHTERKRAPPIWPTRA